MNTTPKVSVIVPNYNHQAFLKERIDTILQQTYQDFELIILDDCSTDDSVSIIESYRNNEHVTHIVLNEQNSGSTFLQWDKGVSLARGEYIWIAESDDAAHPQFLSTLVEQLEKHPEAVVAYAHSLLVNEKGETVNDKRHARNDGAVIVYDSKRFTRWAMLSINELYNASMVVFRHSIYNKIDKSFQQYHLVGDWKFWMGVCLQGSVIEVCQMLNYFRVHSNKVTFKMAKAGTDWPEVASVLRSFIHQLNLKGIRLRTFRGRWTRDFKYSHYPNKKELAQQYPDVFQASKLDSILFKITQRTFKIYRY
jgi:glycosyltransferase involved in cell wall biosynthesis